MRNEWIEIYVGIVGHLRIEHQVPILILT